MATGATSGYLKFTARRNFAELHPQRERIKVYVRPEGYDLAQDESGEVNGIVVHRISDKFLWTLNHEFFVEPTTDLDEVETLLRRSYEAAR